MREVVQVTVLVEAGVLVHEDGVLLRVRADVRVWAQMRVSAQVKV